jgi:hypothetical protein
LPPPRSTIPRPCFDRPSRLQHVPRASSSCRWM